jgi:hypothetical protein
LRYCRRRWRQYLVTRDDDLKRDPMLMKALVGIGIEVVSVSDLARRLSPV